MLGVNHLGGKKVTDYKKHVNGCDCECYAEDVSLRLVQLIYIF